MVDPLSQGLGLTAQTSVPPVLFDIERGPMYGEFQNPRTSSLTNGVRSVVSGDRRRIWRHERVVQIHTVDLDTLVDLDANQAIAGGCDQVVPHSQDAPAWMTLHRDYLQVRIVNSGHLLILPTADSGHQGAESVADQGSGFLGDWYHRLAVGNGGHQAGVQCFHDHSGFGLTDHDVAR